MQRKFQSYKSANSTPEPGPRPSSLSEKVLGKLGKYKALFDSNMLGVAGTDFDNTIVTANDAFLAMIGYTREELERGALQWSTISPEKYEEIDMQKVHELAEYQRIVPFQKEYVHKDGHSVPVIVGAEIIDSEMNLGVCFAIDISDLKRMERKKDDFIGIVSHELKTPLAIMKLTADSLLFSLDKKVNKHEAIEFATEINSQIERLNILVTDLLNMARYEGERESIFQQRHFNLTDCAKSALTDVLLLTHREITFVSEPNIFVYGNKERMKQVIINFLNNAIRFSEADTKIHLRVFKDEKKHRACIEIQDHGVGIAEEFKDKIFERFYRVEHPGSYMAKGTGIGLYVSSEIVKFHQGTITVDSTPGEGSTFRVELPLTEQNGSLSYERSYGKNG